MSGEERKALCAVENYLCTHDSSLQSARDANEFHERKKEMEGSMDAFMLLKWKWLSTRGELFLGYLNEPKMKEFFTRF